MQYPPTYLNKVPKLMKANPEEKPAKGTRANPQPKLLISHLTLTLPLSVSDRPK